MTARAANASNASPADDRPQAGVHELDGVLGTLSEASPLARLRMQAAMQLLEQSGLALPDGVAHGSPEWLQAVIDGLCNLSSRDALTGLANRRQFEVAIGREVDRVARAGEAALLLVLDIDHFKNVNDTHGHAVGDEVIKSVARALLDCVRPMDTVARIGGEEFAIVLPNCPAAFGHAAAERIRGKVEGRPVHIPGDDAAGGDGFEVRVTVSVGGAFAAPWVRSSAKLWVERADRQLYRAKSEGRNRVMLEQPVISHVSAEEKGLLFTPSRLQDLE